MLRFTDDTSAFSPINCAARKRRGQQMARLIRSAEKVGAKINMHALVLIDQASAARTAAEDFRDHEELESGYVVCHDGLAVGWRRDLNEAAGWVPGCIAIDIDGAAWVAVGGNEQDGAKLWERLA